MTQESRAWYIVWGGLLLFLMFGCSHKSMICTFGHIEEQAVLGCVDASTVPGSKDLRPYAPAPAPMPEKNSIGPYWRYDGRDRTGAGK
jgi:hypothetical protein